MRYWGLLSACRYSKRKKTEKVGLMRLSTRRQQEDGMHGICYVMYSLRPEALSLKGLISLTIYLR
jgi:hypothetical protein